MWLDHETFKFHLVQNREINVTIIFIKYSFYDAEKLVALIMICQVFMYYKKLAAFRIFNCRWILESLPCIIGQSKYWMLEWKNRSTRWTCYKINVASLSCWYWENVYNVHGSMNSILNIGSLTNWLRYRLMLLLLMLFVSSYYHQSNNCCTYLPSLHTHHGKYR